MEKAIIGKKVGMTQIFDEAGKVIPVTVIQAGPCTVVQKKTEEKDGYTAVQLGFEEVPEKKLSKPEAGHSKKAGKCLRVLKEFKLEKAAEMNVGDELTATVFAPGDRHQQWPRLPGRGEALRRPRAEEHPRRRPRPPPFRLHGLQHRPVPHL